jgi:hypothetical protein
MECYEPEPGFAEIWAVAAFNAATFSPLPTFSPEWCPSRISLGDTRGEGSKGCASDAENMFKSTFSRVRQANGSRTAHPSQPFLLKKAGK